MAHIVLCGIASVCEQSHQLDALSQTVSTLETKLDSVNSDLSLKKRDLTHIKDTLSNFETKLGNVTLELGSLKKSLDETPRADERQVRCYLGLQCGQ